MIKRYGWNFVAPLPRVWRWKPTVTLYGRPRLRLGMAAFRDEDEDTPMLAFWCGITLQFCFYRTLTRRERRRADTRAAERLVAEAQDWLSERSPW